MQVQNNFCQNIKKLIFLIKFINSVYIAQFLNIFRIGKHSNCAEEINVLKFLKYLKNFQVLLR